ncbi:MAG: hypothetical protein Q8P18_02405 [Pseudomonadota bacterium]|nr:hypothetical protein [Pseudomonadota bacterium]
MSGPAPAVAEAEGPGSPAPRGPSPHRAGLAALLAVGLAVAFVALDPAGTIRPEALLALARGGVPAVLALVAAMGAGAALLRATAPDALDAPSGWLAALGLGVALQGAGMGLFALGGAIGPTAAATVVLATAAGWAARPRVRLPEVPAAVWVIGLVFLVPGLIEALAPPTDTDELSYHLALPRRMVESGHLLGGFLNPDGSRPLPVHLVFALLYALGGEAAPRLWHLAITAVVALGVRALAEARFGRGQGDLPALALLGSWSWLRESGLAYNNHVVALWLLVAADAMLARRWVLMGWMCGFALAAKYTAAPAVAGLALIAAWDGLRTHPRRVLYAAVATLAPVLPWWARNLYEGLHPLFPFAGWPTASLAGDIPGAAFVFVYTEKYGLGRDLLASVLLPWNLLMRAEPDSFVFLGRVSLLWAALAAAALAASRRDGAVRRLAFVAALGFVGWALGAQIVRYLLPIAAIAALAGGALPRRWPAWLLLAVSLPANLAPTLQRSAERVAVATGNQTPDAFLSDALPAWGALRFLREHVPLDAPVAMLFAWHGYYVKQPWILGSVEDHVPTRYWAWQHGDEALHALRDGGVRYLLVGDIHFIKKSYPFLTPGVLQAQFTDPEARLREQLLRDATRLYAAARWEVWRLDPPVDSPDEPPDVTPDVTEVLPDGLDTEARTP